MAPDLARVSSSLDIAFGFRAGSGRLRDAAFVALAVAVHGAMSLIRLQGPSQVEAPVVTEIELPAAAVAAPEPEAEKPREPEAAVAKVSAPSRAPLPAAPAAARAGALVTAKDDSPAKPGELVDFVTDPSGTSYGSGVVARGGTADHGAPGAVAAGTGTAPAPATVKTAAPQDGLVDPANLSRRATLREPNACAGYYPSEASADSGLVTLRVVVLADGRVRSASVTSESPAGQGFGKAATACLQSKHFEPSLDKGGAAVAAAASIRLRFTR